MTIARDLAIIEREELADLRNRWVRLHGGPPPSLRSVVLLRRILAWDVQAGAFGGLDAATLRALRRASRGVEMTLASGTVITREWQGRQHRVEVRDGGFIYDGREWQTLSQIAREITGTRWNGPRFFGLREKA